MNKKFEKPQSRELIEQPKFSYEETKKEKELLTLEKESSDALYGGFRIFFVKLENNKLGIFKPSSEEMPDLRSGIEGGTYFKRERAAYLVDRFLDFNLVPATVIRKIDNKIGSFQEFIPNAHRPSYVEDMPWAKLKKLWIFDYIIWNSDRHRGNLLLDKKGKNVYAIDNGLSFGGDFLKTFKEFFTQPVPGEIREKIKQFSSSEGKKSILKNLLEELLPKNEVVACFKRIEKVTKFLDEKESIRSREEFTFE